MATKKPEKSEIPYRDAAAELDAILDEIEGGTADVDVLAAKVERAAFLIRHCRERLAGTELAVKKVVEELQAAAQDEKPAEES